MSLLWLAACAGEQSPLPAPTPVLPPAPVVSQLTITPGNASLSVGATQAFAVEARTATGALVTAPTVTWTVADSGLLTVSGSAVTARRIGTTLVIATVGSVQAQATVAITPAAAPVASVSINAPSLTTAVGRSLVLNGVLRAADGSITAGTLTWTSTSPAVASIDGQGVVRGIAPGTTLIRATSGTQSASITVSVFSPSSRVVIEPVANVVAGVQSVVGNAGRVSCDFAYTVRSISARGTWQDFTWILQTSSGAPVTRTDPLTPTAFTEGGTLSLRGGWYWESISANQPGFLPYSVTISVGYLEGGVRRVTDPIVLYCRVGSVLTSGTMPTVVTLDPALSVAARAQLVAFVSATDSVRVANNQPMSVPAQRNVVAALNRSGELVLAGMSGPFTTSVSAQSTALLLVRLLLPPGGELPVEGELLDARIQADAEFPSLVTLIRAQAERGESFASASSVAQATRVVRGVLESVVPSSSLFGWNTAASTLAPSFTRFPDLTVATQANAKGGVLTITSRAFVPLDVDARPPNEVLSLDANELCGVLCLKRSVSQQGTIVSPGDGPFTLTARYPASARRQAIETIGIDLVTGVSKILGLPHLPAGDIAETLGAVTNVATVSQTPVFSVALQTLRDALLEAAPDLLLKLAKQSGRSWATSLMGSLISPIKYADAAVWLAGRVGAYADLNRYWSAAPESVSGCWRQGSFVTTCPIEVSITPGTITINGVDTVRAITATITGATNPSLRWRSDNPGVAAIDGTPTGTTATLRGIALGTTTVRATSVQDSTKFAIVTVTVAPRIGITLAPTSATLSVGQSQPLTAVVTGTSNRGVRWRSGNDAVAQVDTLGRVTARAAGIAIITARAVADTTATASATITVNGSAVVITVSPMTASIPVGGTQQLTLSLSGVPAGQSTAMTWSNSNPAVASVTSGSGSLTVTGLAVGTATISVRPAADPTKVATATITVTSGTATTRLTSGAAVSGLSGAAGSSRLYVITVPTGATGLAVRTTGGTGDVDLFVRRGSPPTTSMADCRSEDASTIETCTITNPAAGEWYILLVGYGAYSGATLTATVTGGDGGGGGGGGGGGPGPATCSNILEIPVRPSQLNLDGTKVYGCLRIPGANVVGTYNEDGVPGDDPMILNADGTGNFTYSDSRGMNTPIRWWVHVNADGSYVKQDYPLATRYYVIWLDQSKNIWYRDTLDVQLAADGIMSILYRRKSKG